jgi:hypothetical protein
MTEYEDVSGSYFPVPKPDQRLDQIRSKALAIEIWPIINRSAAKHVNQSSRPHAEASDD